MSRGGYQDRGGARGGQPAAARGRAGGAAPPSAQAESSATEASRGRGAAPRGGRGGAGGEQVRPQDGAWASRPSASPAAAAAAAAPTPQASAQSAAPLTIDRIAKVAVKTLPALNVNAAVPILFGERRTTLFDLKKEAKGDLAAKQRLIDQEKTDLARAAQTVSSVRAMRPPPVTAGDQAISVLVNDVPISIAEGNTLYQYSLAVDPPINNPRRRKEAVTSLLRAHCAAQGTTEPLVTGMILYSARPLHSREATTLRLPHTAVEGQRGWRGTNFALVVTFARTIERSREGINTEEYTVLGAIIREAFDRAGLVKVGNGFFDVEGRFSPAQALQCREDPYESLQLMTGVKVAVHPTPRGLMLNVDMTSRTTRRGTVLDHIGAIRIFATKTKMNVNNVITGELEGAMGVTTYDHERRKQTFKISKIRFDLNPNSALPGDPRGTTFKQYMETHHGLVCRDMTQPLLMVVLEKELDRDGKPRELFYLPEFARLAGQSVQMRSNGRLQQELKAACIVQPEVRFPAIAGLVQRVAGDAATREFLASWGVKVDPRLVEVPARILAPAPLVIEKGRPLQQRVDERSWLIKKGTRVSIPGVAPRKWVVVHSLAPPQYTAFVRSLLDDTINGVGCSWPEPESIEIRGRGMTAVGAAFDLIPEDADFVLVVLGDNNEAVYVQVKKTTLQEWKIPSQCVLFKNASQPDPRRLLNVTSRLAGQMIVKMGGSLWLSASTNFPFEDTLVCGLAFASAASGKKVVSLVACDAKNLAPLQSASKGYDGAVGPVLKDLVAKAAAAFQTATKRPVKHIVIYRPGMHEGAFEKVVLEEVEPVSELAAARKVKLAFLTSLKRCNVRAHPSPPGLLIDDFVLPPIGFSWLTVPQMVRQGTATAMKFSVLTSDIPFADGGALEALTHGLCHMFQGWWASTREPSVVMYATRLAELHAKMDPNREIDVSVRAGSKLPVTGIPAL